MLYQILLPTSSLYVRLDLLVLLVKSQYSCISLQKGKPTNDQRYHRCSIAPSSFKSFDQLLHLPYLNILLRLVSWLTAHDWVKIFLEKHSIFWTWRWSWPSCSPRWPFWKNLMDPAWSSLGWIKVNLFWYGRCEKFLMFRWKRWRADLGRKYKQNGSGSIVPLKRSVSLVVCG